MQAIEPIKDGEQLLALIIRKEATASSTTFLTEPDKTFQAGFVVYPKGSQIPRHTHHPVRRQIDGTSEAILVRSGGCTVDIYRQDRELLVQRSLSAGDLVIFYAGGHGFSLSEDTVLFEIKQGPYSGVDEKERF
jgi:quercetin dioxygenase-like cupin family protein